MFGFPSLAKIAVLVGIIGAVWYGFKWISRLQQARGAAQGVRDRAARDGAAEDTMPCRVCDSYVSVGSARSCGREGCPY